MGLHSRSKAKAKGLAAAAKAAAAAAAEAAGGGDTDIDDSRHVQPPVPPPPPQNSSRSMLPGSLSLSPSNQSPTTSSKRKRRLGNGSLTEVKEKAMAAAVTVAAAAATRAKSPSSSAPSTTTSNRINNNKSSGTSPQQRSKESSHLQITSNSNGERHVGEHISTALENNSTDHIPSTVSFDGGKKREKPKIYLVYGYPTMGDYEIWGEWTIEDFTSFPNSSNSSHTSRSEKEEQQQQQEKEKKEQIKKEEEKGRGEETNCEDNERNDSSSSYSNIVSVTPENEKVGDVYLAKMADFDDDDDDDDDNNDDDYDDNENEVEDDDDGEGDDEDEDDDDGCDDNSGRIQKRRNNDEDLEGDDGESRDNDQKIIVEEEEEEEEEVVVVMEQVGDVYETEIIGLEDDASGSAYEEITLEASAENITADEGGSVLNEEEDGESLLSTPLSSADTPPKLKNAAILSTQSPLSASNSESEAFSPLYQHPTSYAVKPQTPLNLDSPSSTGFMLELHGSDRSIVSAITSYESISSMDVFDVTPVKEKKDVFVSAINRKTIDEMSDETDSEERSHENNLKKSIGDKTADDMSDEADSEERSHKKNLKKPINGKKIEDFSDDIDSEERSYEKNTKKTKKSPKTSKSTKPSNGDDAGRSSPRTTTTTTMTMKLNSDLSSTEGDIKKDNSDRNLTKGSDGAKMKAAKHKPKKKIADPVGDSDKEKVGQKKKKKTPTKKSQSSKSLGSRSARVKNSKSKLEISGSDSDDSALAAMIRPPECTLQERPSSNRVLLEGNIGMSDNFSNQDGTSLDIDEVIMVARKEKGSEVAPKKSPSSRRMIKYVPKSERSTESSNGKGDEISLTSSRHSFQEKMEAIRNNLSKMNRIAEKDAKSTGMGQRSSSARVLSSRSDPGSPKRKKKKKTNKAKSMRSLRPSGTNDVESNGSSSQVRKKKSKSSRDLKEQSSTRKIKNGEVGLTKKSKSTINVVKPSLEEDPRAVGETIKKKSKKKTTKKKAASTRQIL